jgi:Fe-S-cluster containining protein
MKTGIFANINEDLSRQKREVVIKIIREGRTAPQALKIALNAYAWAEELIQRSEAVPPLDPPIICQTGCHFCCFNQVEITPAEAVVIGDYVDRRFTAGEKADLRPRLEAAINFKSGKSKLEISLSRQELPCPLLREGRCAIYEVRPLICRAMHSLEVSPCEAAFRLNRNTGVEHYVHRDEIVGSILKGLLDGCREMGCQAEPLDLAQALRDFLDAASPLEQWITGERTFSSLIYLDE